MAALLQALASTPNAEVNTVRMTHDGDLREPLTVRELTKTHQAGLVEIVQTSDGRVERCARRAARDLRQALE